MSNFALELPFNGTSLGQCSIAIAREIYKRGLNPCIFPIGNTDLSQQKQDEGFNSWLVSNINRAVKEHRRDTPIIKLWHLNGSLQSYSEKQILISFLETDDLTESEQNVIRNNNKVLFCSKEKVDLCKDFNLLNVGFIPLAFDEWNFYENRKKYHEDDRIVFGLLGKLEPLRKNHLKVIQSWAAKYGNDRRYFLNCCIWNHFLKPEDQNNIIGQILDGKRYANIQFLGWQSTNQQYNDVLNYHDIILGMGCESWGLPEFHSLCLGKHSVILNYDGHKEWADKENSVLVEPNEKIIAKDGMFFHGDKSEWNRGNFATFSTEEFLSACDSAIERFKVNRFNSYGIKLRTEFSYQKMVSKILDYLK